MKVNFKTALKKKYLLAGLVVGVISLAILFVLEKKQVINLYTQDKPVVSDDAKTTSTAPTAQEDFTDGGERPITRGDKEEGLISDTGGNVQNMQPQDQWTSSADKVITVYSPAKDSIIKSGDMLAGTSSLTKVYFRLIDDVSGVIAQGTLGVVEGKFSGTFNFTTAGANGRLDIYNATADGVESSNVEIPVRFK